MAQTTSAEQTSSSDTASTTRPRISPAIVAGGILLALTVAVVLLRFYRLAELPPGIHFDEGADGVEALQVLQGEHSVFFPEKASGREAVAVYMIALTTSLLGRTLLAFHLPTALASAGTVFVVFWLGQLLFGRDENGRGATPWRGLLVGGVGAGLLSVSLGQTIIARGAFRANYLPLILCLCLALLWWGRRERKRGAVALAGVCAGLLPYTYIPARFTPFLFLFFGLSFLLPWDGNRGGGEKNERRHLSAIITFLTSELQWIGLFAAVAGLVATPILLYFAMHPEHFFIRSGEVWLFRGHRGSAFGTAMNNVWEHLLVFGFHGDLRSRYNFAGRPMLNSWEAFFFWLGIGMAAWRWRPAHRLLLIWLGVLILPAMLSRDVALGPNTLRMIGAAPAVYLLVGVGIWELFRFLREWWSALPGRAKSIFRANETMAAFALGAVLCSSVLMQGVATYRIFFQEWGGTPEFFRTYDGVWADAAQVLNAQSHAADTVILLPYAWADDHYGFEYLYQSDAPSHVIHATSSYLPRKVEFTLAALENVSTVKIVDWDNGSVGAAANGDDNLIVLLDKHGRYMGSEEFVNFRIHTYTEIALDRSWAFYEHIEPPTVHYDVGISLQGIAMGHGGEQLSSATVELPSLDGDRSLWVALQWQTAPGLHIDYAISLRLHDVEGTRRYQLDDVLVNPNANPTSQWLADELVDTIFYIDFPPDLPEGEYELRLVVYDFATQKPTVELGVLGAGSILGALAACEN